MTRDVYFVRETIMPRKRPAPPKYFLVEVLKKLFPSWDGRKSEIPPDLVVSVDKDGKSNWEKALEEVCKDK